MANKYARQTFNWGRDQRTRQGAQNAKAKCCGQVQVVGVVGGAWVVGRIEEGAGGGLKAGGWRHDEAMRLNSLRLA